MRANASVFTPGVRLNRAVRDFSTIPTPLLDWYEATFQAGSRTDPPSPLQRTAAPSRRVKVARVVVTAQGALHYDRLYDGSSVPAERIFPCGIVLLSSGALYDLATGRTIGATPSGEVIRLPEGWLVARIVHDQVDAKLINDGFTAIPVRCAIQAKRLVQANGRLFAVTCEGLTELSLLMLGKPMLVAKRTWGALASTTWFDGVGIQDTMGSTYLIAPYDTEACAQIRVPELDGLRPIMARAGQRFVSVIALDKHGDYRKFEFSFDHTYQSYTLWQGQADSAELNQAILPRGVVVTIVRDGELVIFVPRNGDTKRVPDRDATTELQLARWDERVLAIRDGSVLSLKLT
jgi:hypothetical protein